MIIQPAIRVGSWSVMAVNIFLVLVLVTGGLALGAAEAGDHAVHG
jgi:hypothetical protein